jgi:hypothetical protein
MIPASRRHSQLPGRGGAHEAADHHESDRNPDSHLQGGVDIRIADRAVNTSEVALMLSVLRFLG